MKSLPASQVGREAHHFCLSIRESHHHPRHLAKILDRMARELHILICNQSNTSPKDLNKVISLDPVLTGQVLRFINSAYYSLPNKVNSLARAIIILGLNTVKNLAISTAILGALGKNTSRSLNMDHFWNHSICVGVAAKALASYKYVPTTMQEEFFIAGLLHDLGKIPLSDCFSEDYEKVLELTVEKKCDLQWAALTVFGINHCDTGRMIAEKWKLTDSRFDCFYISIFVQYIDFISTTI